MAIDDADVAELKATKAAIDDLQARLKELVSKMRQGGATAQEIGEALRT